ncbi:GNAT family N-acetyltransferase [Agaribacterium haliotis]|uniref:GNAT family N-acetyltransferase n=1 Tax=Agaribacterium haliotis TaxID=2013869 RepID=UPI001957FE04|nr:GNAT family N-acetyltransferase [Agaribacterium haliotis]
MLTLRKVSVSDLDKLQQLYKDSRYFHEPWSFAPKHIEYFLQDSYRRLLCLQNDNSIVGTFNLSGLMRGYFHSAYLGYEAFHPWQGKGYMRQGLALFINYAFEELTLHRIEANIQPDNAASLALVQSAGFEFEGCSKAYLNIGGRGWKDHHRWALINNNWKQPRS